MPIDIDTKNGNIVITATGAAAAGQTMKDAVTDLNLSAGESQRIIQSARLQNGELDPNAVSRVERLAKQVQELATTMRGMHAMESRPSTDPESFPIAADQLTSQVTEAALAGMGMVVPQSMSETRTVCGGRENKGGSIDVLVKSHTFMTGPKDDSPSYVVTVNAEGKATHILIPSAVESMPLPDPMANSFG